MSVVSVRARSFILALFIRDDGERFLLGDNGYDFMDSQLHFSANTIENDEVEKQGADGTMLAGQVRRASVQTFDGYVGDATTPKEEIEQMRRDFIAFFAKNHHFRVIYVDCNRNAWQRKGGYLVDAPEVKELWQIHPEYHVGLNFEDVNYYEYDENAEGQEILANIMKVPLSSDVEGGLVWDEDGAVSEDATVVYDGDTATASGKSISIADAVEAPLSGFKLKGETSQQTYTGKNLVYTNGKTDGGITATYNAATGETTISGTAVRTYAVFGAVADVLPAGTYTFSIQSAAPCAVGVATKASGGARTGHNISAGATKTTFTISEDSEQYDIYITSLTANTTYNFTFKAMLESGSSATSFEPYVGGIPAPNPDYPQAVQTVTGENVVKISDGQGNEQSYTIDLGSIELCKIGTYQDYIYPSGGKWYVHKEVGKYVYNNDLTGNGISSTLVAMISPALPIAPNLSTLDGVAVSNMYGTTSTDITKLGGTTSISCIRVNTSIDIADSYNAVKALAAANNLTIYYALATPTDTEITNEALIAQLEAILSQGKTYAGTNNITTVIAAGNEQGELEITYYTRYDAKVVGGGYVWEAGGSGGPTIVTNESISAVSPVWTVFGPALNPQLENVTTGEQIQYVGMIGEGQTLVIDMGQQTALLDGLNVVANIVGDYLSLAPGSNTLLFSADSDAPESEIGWSEIVG